MLRARGFCSSKRPGWNSALRPLFRLAPDAFDFGIGRYIAGGFFLMAFGVNGPEIIIVMRATMHKRMNVIPFDFAIRRNSLAA